MSTLRRRRTTHPSHYYARQAHTADCRFPSRPCVCTVTEYAAPTWVERHGELIAAIIGTAAIAFALGLIVALNFAEAAAR